MTYWNKINSKGNSRFSHPAWLADLKGAGDAPPPPAYFVCFSRKIGQVTGWHPITEYGIWIRQTSLPVHQNKGSKKINTFCTRYPTAKCHQSKSDQWTSWTLNLASTQTLRWAHFLYIHLRTLTVAARLFKSLNLFIHIHKKIKKNWKTNELPHVYVYVTPWLRSIYFRRWSQIYVWRR